MHSGSLLVTACVTSEGLKVLLCSYEHVTKHTHTLFVHSRALSFLELRGCPILTLNLPSVPSFGLQSSLALVLCCDGTGTNKSSKPRDSEDGARVLQKKSISGLSKVNLGSGCVDSRIKPSMQNPPCKQYNAEIVCLVRRTSFLICSSTCTDLK